ncbi:DNA-binding domain-containing protein [Paraburkholderia jirisanensis]
MTMPVAFPPACTTGFAAAFARGLMDPSSAAPGELVAAAGKGVVSRYNVYRNNVTVSLIDALAALYPAVARITGSEFFRAMARFHVRATPPVSPLLFEYGRDFPAFIEGYEYAQQMPWLGDVARIERAWMDAYHAADRSVLPMQTLTDMHPEQLGDLHFTPHPATRIVRSAYPAVAIFAMNRRSGPIEPLCSSEPENALITRPAQEVMVSTLPAGAATFLNSLIAGESLGIAAAAAFDAAPSFDLPANLSGMISFGVFTALHTGA